MNRKLYNQEKYFNTFSEKQFQKCFKKKSAFDFDLIMNFQDIKVHSKDVVMNNQ